MTATPDVSPAMPDVSPRFKPKDPGKFVAWLEPLLLPGDGYIADPRAVGNDGTFVITLAGRGRVGILRVGPGERLRITGDLFEVIDGDLSCGDVLQTVSRRSRDTTLYVAGPMTARPDFNRPAFHHAAAKLRADGYVVMNPAEGPDRASWGDYMRAGLHQVASADALAVLPGWEASRGAVLEVHVAHALSMPVAPVDVWLEAP